MQKQYVFNRHLNNNYKKEQNKLLSKRIKKAKSSIDLRCPESFTFFKTHFKEGVSKDKSINNIYIIIFKHKYSKEI